MTNEAYLEHCGVFVSKLKKNNNVTVKLIFDYGLSKQ